MPAVAQHIGTAPRDGTHIIGFDRNGGWREMWFKVDQYEGEFWTDDFDSEPEPTHWIEMPIEITVERTRELRLSTG